MATSGKDVINPNRKNLLLKIAPAQPFRIQYIKGHAEHNALYWGIKFKYIKCNPNGINGYEYTLTAKGWAAIGGVQWERTSHIRQETFVGLLNMVIRFFPSHQNPYCLIIRHSEIPSFRWQPGFQFLTEIEAKEFAAAAVAHFEANPHEVAGLKATPLPAIPENFTKP